jgi:long-chain fatty acid transport protein
LGASVISLSGASIDYDDDWAGRYLNTKVELLTLTVYPTVAYRVNEWLSLGGGPQIWYAKLDLETKAPPPAGTGTVEIDGDDVTYGFGLGALIELSERTRFGIVYQSQVEPKFSGDVEFSGGAVAADAGVDTEITLARFIHLSGYHELNEQWALLGTIGWENWSEFDNVNLSTGAGSRKIPRNWDDTWKFAAGLHYRPTAQWLLQLGFSYDTSPIDTDDRTPDMPIDRQIRYAAGIQYKWSDRLSTGVQFEYADFGEGKIRNNLLRGEYDTNDLFILGLNANWKF